MSDDWDTVTKIGSKTRGSGGGPRETVIRGKSALNAAQRSGGVIGTEKKYATGNSSTIKSSSQTGQRMTKVDRSDEIVKPKIVTREIANHIAAARNSKTPTMTQEDLAKKSLLTKAIITEHENAKAPYNQAHIDKISNALGVFITGSQAGKPTPKAIKQAERDAARAAEKK